MCFRDLWTINIPQINAQWNVSFSIERYASNKILAPVPEFDKLQALKMCNM